MFDSNRFIATQKLTTEQLSDLRDLIIRCDYQGKLYWSILEQKRPQVSMYLCYHKQQLQAFITFYLFQHFEANVLIAPGCRFKTFYPDFIHAVKQNFELKALRNLLISGAHKAPRPYPEAEFAHSEFIMQRKRKTLEQFDDHPLTMHQATEEDTGSILELDKACFSTPSIALESRLDSLLSDRNYYIGMAEWNRQTIGKIHLHFDNHKATIYDFAIFPAFQGQGHGSMLLKHAINYSLTKGIEVIELEVEVTNKNAIALYEKSGFTTAHSYDFWRIPQLTTLCKND